MANGPVPNATASNPKYSLTGSVSRRPYALIAGVSGGVEFVRADLTAMFAAYDVVEDACEGSLAIKSRTTEYLPDPDPRANDSKRYKDYITRAVFYNVTGRTLEGLLGQVFIREPHVKVPPSLEIVVKDCDGSGLSLAQNAKRANEFVLKFGRCGALADFPTTRGFVTRDQILKGNIRPTITIYDPANIRNWRTITVQGRQLLSLVVLAETYDKDDDGFKSETDTQYRVLRLVPAYMEGDVQKYKATVQIYRNSDDKFNGGEVLELRDAKGNPLEELPFTFIGAKTNNAQVDKPPLFDLADLNIAHYRNSAELEENMFMVGQDTPWVTGVTEEWAKDVLHGTVQLGSRAIVPLPEGASIGLLQAQPNSLISVEMEHKERQMVALGAKLVENKQVQRTATEANQEEAAETSVLASTANNVSAAFRWCLEWCAIFVGDVTQDKDARSKAVEFKLNTEFEISNMSPQQLAETVKTWQEGLLTDKEARDIVTKAGFATEDFETWQREKEEKAAVAMQQMADQMQLEAGSGSEDSDEGDEDTSDNNPTQKRQEAAR